MKKLIIRMLREIKNHLGQFISIVLIIAIGSAMFSGMLGAIVSISTGVNRYYNDQRLADLWVTVRGATQEQVEELESENHLEVEGRYTLNLDAQLQGKEVSLRAHSLTDMNAVKLKEGSLPQNPRECVIDSKFAKANQLIIGDYITGVTESVDTSSDNSGNTESLLITGIGDSPEYAYKVKDGASAVVSQKTFGVIYCTKDTLVELIKNSPVYLEKIADIKAKLGEGPKAEASIKELNDTMLQYQELLIKSDDLTSTIALIEKQDYYVASVQRTDQASFNMVQGGIDTISTISYIFPIVFFLVAALILLISMTKMVENQRMQIAVIEAIGISKSKVRFGYMFYAAMASLLGSILFSFLGNKLISHVLIKMFKNRFSIIGITPVMNPFLLLAPFVLAFILSSLAAVIAVGGVLRLDPAQAMRPKPPRKSKTILIERFTLLWRRLSYSSKLIFRNLFLNKARVLVSSIGITGSVMLMLTGLSLQHAATGIMESKSDSIGYDLSVVYNTPINNSSEISFNTNMDQIELTKTMKATLPELNAQNITVQIIPDHCSLVRLYDRKDNLLQVNQDSVIIPHTLADDFDITVGEKIKLMIDDKETDFTVSGISAQYTGSTIYISENSANHAGLDYTYNTVMLKLSNSNNSEALKDELLTQSDVKAVNSKSDITGAAADNLKLLNAIIIIIIVASVIMSVAVIYNITSIHLFERSREFATLMVLGYYTKEVGRLLFTENLVITVLGCFCGLPCGMILFKVILGTFAKSGVILPDTISLSIIIVVFSITLLFSVMTNLVMKKKIATIDMIEALKGVE